MVSFNPACYAPSALTSYIPSSIACAPPPSYFSQAYATATSPVTSTYTTLRTIMDALVSLPMLSFFLIPISSSYATSLNLLFFYLTWSTLVLTTPPLQVELVGTLAVKILFSLLPSLLFLAFDALLPSASESMKAIGPAALPLLNADRKRALSFAQKLGWSLFNTLLGVILQSIVEFLCTRVLTIRSALRVTTTLPLPWGIAKDLLRGYVFRECIAYALHRFILHPDRSNILSNWHEIWYHNIAAPFPFSGSYDHPAAYLLRVFLPAYLPAVIFRFHLLTYMIWTALISLEELFANSGYSTVPTNFILGGIARRTDKHVICGGVGNFGPIGWLDWVLGTSVGGDIMDDALAEADKHGVAGKVDGAMEKVKRKGRDVAKRGRGGARRRANGDRSNED